MKNEKLLGTLIASTVAAFAMSGVAFADEGTAEKKADSHFCRNNSCKGKSACKGYENDSCKGQNGCKKKGFIEANNAKECKKAGGKWMKGKAESTDKADGKT